MTVCYNDGGVLARRPLFDALCFGAGHYFLRFPKLFRYSHTYKYLYMVECITSGKGKGNEMTFTEEQIKETMKECGLGRADAIRILERTEIDWQNDYEDMLDAYTL